MPNSPLGKVPYPSGPDAPAAAADMMGLVMAMDPRLVLPAIDEADRDSKYANAPTSTMVVSGPSKKIWVKTGPGPTDWWVVYERQEVRTGFTALTGWELDMVLAIRNTYTTEVRIRARRTGSDITANPHTANSPGNISPDVDVCIIPAQVSANLGEFQVVGLFRSDVNSGSASLRTDGLIRLYDMHPGATIANGQMLWFSITWNN